jgi:uncharacterized protein (TIRG00374 family)
MLLEIAMKRLHVLLLACGALFLVYLFWTVGMRELWRELALLGWGLIPIMLGEGLSEMIHTVAWRHCLSGPLKSLSWFSLFRIRMAGYAINYLTPTAALGGEVTKGILLASHHRGPEAASGVLIDKVCFAVAHLTFVVIGACLVLWRLPIPKPVWMGLLSSGALLASGILTFLFLQQQGKLGTIVRWMAARKGADHPLQKAARNLTEVDETMMRFYRERPKDLVLAICWHMAGYSLGIAQTWLFFHLLGHDASWLVAAGMWFLSMWFDLLTFAVPQNLGTLEGTRILAFRAFGYTALMGMTYGIAFRLAQIFWACAGLVSYALLTSRKTAPGGPLVPDALLAASSPAPNSPKGYPFQSSTLRQANLAQDRIIAARQRKPMDNAGEASSAP